MCAWSQAIEKIWQNHFGESGAAMTSPLLAALLVLLAWWLSTGLILWRVRVADNGTARAHLYSVIFGLPLVALGLWGAAISRADTSAGGVYAGFVAALALWAWIELAFLSGIITGPNRTVSPRALSGRPRLTRALLAVLWHEAALIAGMIGLTALQWGAANPIAAATFALLLGARALAKINLFLGVPRINVQFIPRPIAHIASHFRIAPASAFLPLSIGVLALTSIGLLQFAVQAAAPETALGYIVLTTLSALALLEHLFMVLPLPDAKLWAWMLPKAKQPIKTFEDTNGL
jgi:putative photosynthetic complex assembly protein 2